MPIYDTTVILNPQLEEKGIDARIKEIVGRIEENGGKMVRENRMGMRRLAYEIQKLSQGYYANFIYDGNGDLVKELERKFRLDESCLRFLTCLYQEVAPPKERVMRDRPVTSATDKPAETKTETTAPTTSEAAPAEASQPAQSEAKPVADEAVAPTPAPEPEAPATPATPATPEVAENPSEKDDSATEMEEL